MFSNNRIFVFLSVLLIIGSCSKDGSEAPLNPDDTIAISCNDGIQNGDETGVDCGGSCTNSCITNNEDSRILNGTISEEKILDASITYQLNGTLNVQSGGVLIIPSGTKIEASAGISSQIIIEQGADIVINGTENNPVIMELKSGEIENWGGIVIAGNAPSTAGQNSTIGDSSVTYAGSEPADNSGSISYLVIKNAGVASATNQFGNAALSLLGVGTATTIDHVAIFNSDQDALAIHGGIFTLENLYVENASNTSINWTEGWAGTLTNTLVVNNEDFNQIVSAKGTNGYPNLSNFTAISEEKNTAFNFNDDTGANISGLALMGFKNSFLLANSVTTDNIKIDGNTVEPTLPYIGNSNIEQSAFSWAGDLSAINFLSVSGEITTDITFETEVTYFLSGTLSIKNGATLTINPGTKIIADVESGNSTSTYIVVRQGGDININGTAAMPVVMESSLGNSGDWGGLVIAGKATTTAGTVAIAEIGDITYGGSEDTDSSGNINHLIIKNAGAKIDTDSEYNGLSLYGVGSGTVINNIAIIDGLDDGIEFFGGTVDVSNIYLENNLDDAIDYTEGWNGKITNALIVNTIDNFSSAIEADGDNGFPEFENIHCISETGGTAIIGKNNSGASFNKLALLGFDASFDFTESGNNTNFMVDSEIANSAIPYIASSTVDSSDFDWVENKQLINSVVIHGSINSNFMLDADITYYLDGPLSVEANADLTIPAGTTIIADVEEGDETNTYIVVQQNATIHIEGTAQNPVVMTSANNTPGDWGGLILAGNGVTALGENSLAEIGNISYGGTNNLDSSGSITYLKLENTGAQITAESQYNGLSLYAVGANTTLENIAILNGNDDGVEIFGGAATIQNLYLKNNADDAIDWIEEWEGSITNAYVEINNRFSSVIEAEGDATSPTITNLTAVSSDGGSALVFRRQSGATIDGISLNGFENSLIMVDNAPLSNVILNGAISDPNNNYELPSSIDPSLFNWVTE
ncbi:hypothetical protein GCM10011414_23240 [Croceivirga lutea]|uniref:beta strand repeat-containing protein n=1 Tax=Croceivirga lutea TaxID=1775167 RepID=UPI00163A741B|nr:hypothetical protein [Croceivirga lutea]GGG52942.1 hypothetical protein GCM10011414_23240 [Croceivirga lutea]